MNLNLTYLRKILGLEPPGGPALAFLYGILPVIDARMGSNYVIMNSAAESAAAPVAGTSIVELTMPEDSIVLIRTNLFTRVAPAATRVMAMEMRDESNTVLFLQYLPLPPRAGELIHPPDWGPLLLKNGWKVDLITVDAFGAGETVVASLSIFRFLKN